MSYKDYVF